jgi:phospholipase/carboxylesterase
MCGLPILVSHGEADDDLSFEAGEKLRDWLVESGADVTWVPFQGGHQIPLGVWRRLRQFLTQMALSSSFG